ncbi:hypothetical protein IWQ60_005961 [Tieghemiomyces parasiticus]|uniref:Pentacotripeptide-repeat region of PRORP domain-containing protein n=1 Tax=Tieghemiomyces parasiticus TaxID=78921 RepID=A0A9W8AAT1_9FUNG|nr:hypothetical protein IWQ60_005961 [Tieghemiomyces parasiticus]
MITDHTATLARTARACRFRTSTRQFPLYGGRVTGLPLACQAQSTTPVAFRSVSTTREPPPTPYVPNRVVGRIMEYQSTHHTQFPPDVEPAASQCLELAQAKRRDRDATWTAYLALRGAGHHIYLTDSNYTILLLHFLPGLARQLRMVGLNPLHMMPRYQLYAGEYSEEMDREAWLPVRILQKTAQTGVQTTRVRQLVEDWLARDSQRAARSPPIATTPLTLTYYRTMGLALCMLRMHREMRDLVARLRAQPGLIPGLGVLGPLLTVYCHEGDFEGANWTMGVIRRTEPFPNTLALVAVIRLFARAGRLDEARAYFDQLRRLRFVSSTEPYTDLISAYGIAGNMAEIARIYGTMRHTFATLTSADFSVVVTAYVTAGSVDEALRTLANMFRRKLRPQIRTLDGLVQACAREGQLETLGAIKDLYMQSQGKPSIVVRTAIARGFARAGQFATADGLLTHIDHQTVARRPAVVNALLRTYYALNRRTDALGLIRTVLENQDYLEPSTIQLVQELSVQYNSPDLIKVLVAAVEADPTRVDDELRERILTFQRFAASNFVAMAASTRTTAGRSTPPPRSSLAASAQAKDGGSVSGRPMDYEEVVGRTAPQVMGHRTASKSRRPPDRTSAMRF